MKMIVVIFRDRVAIEPSLKKLMRCKDMPRFRMTIPLDTRQVKQREEKTLAVILIPM